MYIHTYMCPHDPIEPFDACTSETEEKKSRAFWNLSVVL
jgi:hypothetical protein